MKYYIAGCVFTAQFPQLSFKIQDFVKEKYGLSIVRCCVRNYKVREFEDRLEGTAFSDRWNNTQHSVVFEPDDEVYSLCHNCNNIIEELNPSVRVHSIWELIADDKSFKYPDYSGMTVTIQDCWRSRDRAEEQEAIRNILGKMNIDYQELEENKEKTDFCGASLYRPQPPRNPRLAPKHYLCNIGDKFKEHTDEEQKLIMQNYCGRFKTDIVVCYCQYCLEGLLLGGKDGRHIAEMLF